MDESRSGSLQQTSSGQKRKGSQRTITDYYLNQNHSERPTYTQLHTMKGNEADQGQGQRQQEFSSSSRLAEQQDERSAKRIKLESRLQRVSTNAGGETSESDAATRTHQEYIGNRGRYSLPVSTSVSSSLISKSKPSTSLRDTSKLPSEESSSNSGSCLVKGRSSLIASVRAVDSSLLKSDLQESSAEMKYKAMLMWQKVRAENLDCDYVKLFSKREADKLFQDLNATLTYFSGDLAQVRIYGKTFDVPRKVVAHGDEGVTYTYSGTKIPAKPWTPALNQIKERVQEVTQHLFNFVLINRYDDGNHYMAEHRDDEKELRHAAPIASVSLGCTRDFVFRHADSRGREAKRQIAPIKLQLEHGSLLVMKYPTNKYWYHALPVRRKTMLPRINLTFRDIITTK